MAFEARGLGVRRAILHVADGFTILGSDTSMFMPLIDALIAKYAIV